MSKLRIALVVLAGLTSFVLLSHIVSQTQSHSSLDSPKPRESESPDRTDFKWNMKTPDGKDFSLASVKGKVLLVNLWASWCGPCKEEMPSLQSLYDKTGHEIVFVLVTDEDPATVTEYFRANKYTMPVYISDEVPDTFNQVNGIPVTFIIAPDGRVAYQHIGATNWDTDEVIDFLYQLIE